MFKNNKKGVAGLQIFLSVIAIIFVIGVLIMAFALTGAKLADAPGTYDGTTSTGLNETINITAANGTSYLSVAGYKGVACTVYNLTTSVNQSLLGTGNYSVTNCKVQNLTNVYTNQNWSVYYNYTYQIPNVAGSVIQNSTSAISSATTWFPIFIVIAAIVVLILMIVLVIVSLRGAGLMGGNMGA